MQASVLVAASLCAACATPDVARAALGDDLAVTLSREGYGTLPMVVVTITNRSERTICILRDALENPESYEMALYLYDAGGNALAPQQGDGFYRRPLEGVVRIAAGATVRGHYDLDAHYRIPGGGTPFPSGMSAQASFSYGPCPRDAGRLPVPPDLENIRSRRATSTRQAI